MLATAIVEMVPRVWTRRPISAFLVLLGYLIVHFFEHTLTPHFIGEETHSSEFMEAHKGYSVLAAS